jgi:hypothetical protein
MIMPDLILPPSLYRGFKTPISLKPPSPSSLQIPGISAFGRRSGPLADEDGGTRQRIYGQKKGT